MYRILNSGMNATSGAGPGRCGVTCSHILPETPGV